MATLVSPGVSVTVTDESQYGAAGPGTIPLIVIATQTNKLQSGSSTAIAAGTTPANAGKLWLITSQRDALTTFGSPVFYTSGGSPEYDNELNELGLFTLYEYLGIANQAYVLRADLDLAQLVPTTTEPSGPPASNQNWLDINSTTFGIFKSNGNSNPAFSWAAKTPLVINSLANLEMVKQGNLASPYKITSGSAAVITANGSLVINGIEIPLTLGQSISDVTSTINNSAALSLLLACRSKPCRATPCLPPPCLPHRSIAHAAIPFLACVAIPHGSFPRQSLPALPRRCLPRRT